MTKYKVSKELPHSRGNIDYDTIYIKPNSGEYDQSTDIVKFDKKDGSLWAVMRTGKFLTFQHKYFSVPKDSFLEILFSRYPEDYEFFLWHPEARNGIWEEDRND